jgi:prepilin-type N-terminal cleavage/methylation domain-containing protein
LRAHHHHGFTLVEMLVATAVFVIGFVGVFVLFLSGVRFRKLSEDLTRTALASSSLIAEIRIDAGREGGGSKPPSDYVGNGFATDGAELNDGSGKVPLFPYPQQPGIWYRVMSCSNLSGDAADAKTIALKFQLVVLSFPTSDTALTFTELQRRLRLTDSTGSLITDDPGLVVSELTRRGAAMTTTAVIVRQPSWMP